jgi:hypothetical protein
MCLRSGTALLDNQATIPAPTVFRGLSAVCEWARGPILAFASLWTPRPDPRDGCYAPDPFVTERPFLSDDWPR